MARALSMARSSRVALLLLMLPSAARARAVIELPPGEEAAQWEAALQLGRQLLPELELGLAVGPEPSVRILRDQAGWLLDVRTAEGIAEPIAMAAPSSEAERLELLLVCVDALGRTQDASPPIAAAPPPEGAGPWRFQPLSLRVGLDLIPGEHRPPHLQLEPSSLAWHRLGLSPTLSWAPPVSVDAEHRLRSAALGLGAWYEAGGRLRVRLGAGLDLELRQLHAQDSALLRDWSLAPSAGSELCIPIREGWRGLLGVRGYAALPPTILELGSDEVALPTWQLLLSVGIRTPWPSSTL
jgi:hypothetical protein